MLLELAAVRVEAIQVGVIDRGRQAGLDQLGDQAEAAGPGRRTRDSRPWRPGRPAGQPFEPRTAGVGDQCCIARRTEGASRARRDPGGQAIEGFDLRGGLGALGHAQPAAELLEPGERWDDLPAARKRTGQRERLVDMQPCRIAVRARCGGRARGPASRAPLCPPWSGPCARSPCCRSASGSGWGIPRFARSPAAVVPAASRTARASGAVPRDRRPSSLRRPGSRASAAACDTRRRDTAPRYSDRRCRRQAEPRPGSGPSLTASHRPGRLRIGPGTCGTVGPQASKADEPRPRRSISRRVGCMEIPFVNEK